MNIDIRFEGKKFSPKKLKHLTKLPIEVIVESGEITSIGRYKNKPAPYGLGLLKVKSEPKKQVQDLLDIYLGKLVDKKDEIKLSGVEEIIIDVETPFVKDSEFSFEKSILVKLLQLNARIDIHSIKDESASEKLTYIKLVNELNSLIDSLNTSNKVEIIKYFEKYIKTDYNTLSKGIKRVRKTAKS